MPCQSIEFFFFLVQELMSQMDEHNSTHTLLSAQMKNLNVCWLLFLVVLLRLNFVQYRIWLKKKQTVTQFAELRYIFRQSAMYVIFRLLRPVTCLPAFVSLFYISLQSSSEFFYHPSCGCNFKLLLKCYFFVSQDDLRRANRDLNQRKR